MNLEKPRGRRDRRSPVSWTTRARVFAEPRGPPSEINLKRPPPLSPLAVLVETRSGARDCSSEKHAALSLRAREPASRGLMLILFVYDYVCL